MIGLFGALLVILALILLRDGYQFIDTKIGKIGDEIHPIVEIWLSGFVIGILLLYVGDVILSLK